VRYLIAENRGRTVFAVTDKAGLKAHQKEKPMHVNRTFSKIAALIITLAFGVSAQQQEWPFRVQYDPGSTTQYHIPKLEPPEAVAAPVTRAQAPPSQQAQHHSLKALVRHAAFWTGQHTPDSAPAAQPQDTSTK